ncbi:MULTISPECIES: CDP-glycerol glycerophosphotransferase family protein [Bacillus]|uniref:CDP-glycerol glycerophosphotransferase family protein n=1 Tax=Bacillus TaxID=1386 RepID=UPI001CC95DF7|nr:CDP-glycerol glycerophosphotransferase family protein [Bacillus sp. RAR_M1_44]MCA0163752.1 CDP-glycerol glycerophosphotransferase family protein [Bacillus sp. RAR_M1_44]
MYMTKIVKVFFQIVYTVFSKLIPVNQQKIVIASYRDNNINENFKNVYDELIKQPHLKIVLLFRKSESGFLGKFFYINYLLRTLYHIATCKVLLLDDYYYPLYLIKKRSETKVVQIWHACGAFKKFGHSIKDKQGGPSSAYLKVVPVHSNYDVAIVSSEEAIGPFSEAFNMPKQKILATGVPRTDFFYSEEHIHEVKKRFHEEYPELKNKVKVLYAPTYRGGVNKQHGEQLLLNQETLFRHLDPQHYELLINVHPYMRKSSFGEADISEKFTLYELMIVSDVLVTDYSSVIFEYSLLNKPMFFYCPDLENYVQERDFYYPFHEFAPGPIRTKMEPLIEDLKNVSLDKTQTDFRSFSKRFMNRCDGHSTERVVSLILSLLNEGERVFEI